MCCVPCHTPALLPCNNLFVTVLSVRPVSTWSFFLVFGDVKIKERNKRNPLHERASAEELLLSVA